ncbi:MAG: hypothetical protein HYY40_07215 [Bacteroidetes bacterium]|nr:hypothetical protein [Bacteroidota bacterium]
MRNSFAMTNLINSTGDFFYSLFEIMPVLGNLPNKVFIVTALVLITGWIFLLRKFQREDAIK